MDERKPRIVELLARIKYHENEIRKIEHYIEVEWPEEIRYHAERFRRHVDTTERR